MTRKLFHTIFLVVMGVYLMLNGFYFLSKPAGGGDESLFLSDLALINDQGWISAIEKGISVPYMLVSYPLTFVVDSVWALRLANLLLLAALVLYCYHNLKLTSLRFHAILLFVCCTIGYFMVGLNDGLFAVCSIIFFAETYKLITQRSYTSIAWWGVALLLLIFTRKLWIVFIPGIAFSVFMMWRYASVNARTSIAPLVLLALLVALNVPSLLAEKGISYDQKQPPETTQATWAQRQYLAQLQVNEGTLANFNHPTWEATDAYLEKHGNNALPASLFSALTYDPIFTIKEFFKDLAYILTYSIRSVGLLLLTVIGFGIVRIWKEKAITKHQYIPILVGLMLSVFALIIISFVELRWLTSLFVMTVIGFWKLSETKQLPNLVVLGNYAILMLLAAYGSYSYFNKIEW